MNNKNHNHLHPPVDPAGLQEKGVRHWAELPPAERLQLREQYVRYLDGIPQSCALNMKAMRFRYWLKGVGVAA